MNDWKVKQGQLACGWCIIGEMVSEKAALGTFIVIYSNKFGIDPISREWSMSFEQDSKITEF